MEEPVVERLVALRLLQKADPERPRISALVAADPVSMRWVPSYADEASWVRLVRGRHKILGAFDPDDRLVGFLDFTIARDDSSAIAYWVVPDRRGDGWGTAIIRDGVAWVHRHVRASRFLASVDVENAASGRALAANGFQHRATRGRMQHWERLLPAD